jgi:hypothetical protein
MVQCKGLGLIEIRTLHSMIGTIPKALQVHSREYDRGAMCSIGRKSLLAFGLLWKCLHHAWGCFMRFGVHGVCSAPGWSVMPLHMGDGS